MGNLVRLRVPLVFGFATFVLICAAFAQRPFREYPGYEYGKLPAPFRLAGARRMDVRTPNVPFPTPLLSRRISPALSCRLVERQNGLDHRYPRSDRHLSEAVRRLTRIKPGR